jgi:hypothetical protein
VERAEQITAESILAQSLDGGARKRFANAFLEPPNPFNPKARRRPKQDAVILGVLILVALGLVLYFNITAVVSLHSGS